MPRTLGQSGHEIPAAQGFFVEHRGEALTNVGARRRSSGVSSYLSGDVSIVSTPADVESNVSCGPDRLGAAVVVNEGCSEFQTAAKAGANVVVEYSMACFWG
jgi:hypothetical protein